MTFASALEADVEATLGKLHESDTVTVRRALSVIQRAASEIEANLVLLRDHEAPRQARVKTERETRERAEQETRDREAQAKAERVAARLARRAPKGKSK